MATTSSSLSRALDLLGGASGPREGVSRSDQGIALVRRGIPALALERLARTIGWPALRVARLLGLSPRTYARRRREPRGVLDLAASDRLLRLARVVARAEEVLGSRERGVRWLCGPVRALGGSAPVDLLDTDLGTRDVEAVLGRIEHGIVG